MAGTRAQFNAFVGKLGLQHFSSDELLVKVGSMPGRPTNPRPDKQLWPNLVPTILVLDALRAELGRPITLLSVYRAPEYNKAVGGVEKSQHQDFRAIDFRCSGRSPSQMAEVLRSWRGRPFASPVPLKLVGKLAPLDTDGLKVNQTAQGLAFVFAGGIGVYNTFVHLDSRGINNNWTGSS